MTKINLKCKRYKLVRSLCRIHLGFWKEGYKFKYHSIHDTPKTLRNAGNQNHKEVTGKFGTLGLLWDKFMYIYGRGERWMITDRKRKV